jgi:hypothetical protein
MVPAFGICPMKFENDGIKFDSNGNRPINKINRPIMKRIIFCLILPCLIFYNKNKVNKDEQGS